MPNWCMTTIKFYSEDKEQVEAMHKKFREIMDGEPTVENGFGHGFMGDYANTFLPELGHDKVECRGHVDQIDDVEQLDQYWVFTVWTVTAWGAKMGMWNEIVKRFYPKVEIAYIAEEGGNDYYCVWDSTADKKFYPEKFYFDGCFPKEEGHCEYIDDRYSFQSIEEIHEYLDNHLPFDYLHTDNLDALTENIQNKLDDYGELHEYDESLYVNIVEFAVIAPADFELTI